MGDPLAARATTSTSPVSFAISNTANDLTLDDIGGLLFGAKLDSVGGKGGVSGSASKLTAWRVGARRHR